MCDLWGSPRTRWGSLRLNLRESSSVSVYGEILYGGIVEHVSRWEARLFPRCFRFCLAAVPLKKKNIGWTGWRFLALGSRQAQPPLLSTAGFASASPFERHLKAANQRRGLAVPLLPTANRILCLLWRVGGGGDEMAMKCHVGTRSQLSAAQYWPGSCSRVFTAWNMVPLHHPFRVVFVQLMFIQSFLPSHRFPV